MIVTVTVRWKCGAGRSSPAAIMSRLESMISAESIDRKCRCALAGLGVIGAIVGGPGQETTPNLDKGS
jgi:hypothetical protein